MKQKSTFRKLVLTLGILLSVTATLKAQIAALTDFASGTKAAYCSGEHVKLTSTASGAASYVWKRYAGVGTGGTVTNLTENSATLDDAPTTPGYYTYVSTAVNSDNCTSTDSQPFTIYVLPGINATATENAGGKTSYCTNDFPTTSMQLTAGVSQTATTTETFAYNYQWYKDGTAITNETNATYTLTQANDAAVGAHHYTVNVTFKVKPACAATSSSVDITVNDIPGQPTITITP